MLKIKLENGLILSVKEKNYKNFRLDLDECGDDGIDFELLEFYEDSHLTLRELNPEGNYVTIQNFYVESETSSGPVSGNMLWFNFVGKSDISEKKDFPESIKKKYKLGKYSSRKDHGLLDEMIYFINGKPITNPEIFTDDDDRVEEMEYGEYILKYDDVDWENLSKYL